MLPVLVLVLLAWSWVVAGLEPFAGSSAAAVLATGGTAMVVGAARWPRAEPGQPCLRAVFPWLVVASALAAWQLVAYGQEPRHDHPTISSLTNAALDGRLLRTLAFAGWTVAAAWLARR